MSMPDSFFKNLSDKEERVFKKWARDNYKPGSAISPLWHPAVRKECERINEGNKGTSN